MCDRTVTVENHVIKGQLNGGVFSCAPPWPVQIENLRVELLKIERSEA